MSRHTVQQVAQELGVTEQDVITVAEVELPDAQEWDGEQWLSDHGRQVVITHFRGGLDLQP